MFKKSILLVTFSSLLIIGCGGPSKYQLAQVEKQRIAKAMSSISIITVKPTKAYTVKYKSTYSSQGQNENKMRNSIENSFRKEAVKANADAVFIDGGIVNLPVENNRFKFSMKAVAQFIKYTK